MNTIGVDINGKQRLPNALGHDVFLFQMVPENNNLKLIQMGSEGSLYLSCNITGRSDPYNGLGCAYKVLTDANYFKKLR